MKSFKILPITLLLVTSFVKADEATEFKNNIEIRVSKMMADAKELEIDDEIKTQIKIEILLKN